MKDRVNAISLASAEDFRRDSDVFAAGVRDTESQRRTSAAFERGLQTRDGEIALRVIFAELGHR